MVDSVLMYLSKHGKYIKAVDCHNKSTAKVIIRHLPAGMQPTSLQFSGLVLQLSPASGVGGVLGAAATLAALKQLRLSSCSLLDGMDANSIAAALAQLPAGLEHLSISGLYSHTDKET